MQLEQTLLVSAQALQDIIMYCQGVGNVEIMGVGKLEPAPGFPDLMHVSRVEILHQEVNGGYAKFDADTWNVLDAIEPDDDEKAKWCVNWHSHVNMGTGRSSVDDTMYEANRGAFNHYIGLIFNKRFEFSGYEFVDKPVRRKNLELNRIYPVELLNEYQFLHSVNPANSVGLILALLERTGHKSDPDRREYINARIKECVQEHKIGNIGSTLKDINKWYNKEPYSSGSTALVKNWRQTEIEDAKRYYKLTKDELKRIDAFIRKWDFAWDSNAQEYYSVSLKGPGMSYEELMFAALPNMHEAGVMFGDDVEKLIYQMWEYKTPIKVGG